MRIIVWTIGDLAKSIKDRQERELDVNIIVDGARGNGKSTLCYKLLTRTGKFNPEKDLMFTRDDVMNGIINRKFSCIQADEMITSAHNRNFFSSDQQKFIQMMNIYRNNFNILMGCIPNFYDMDPQVRKLMKIRITVIKRGVAIIQIAKSSLYGNDPWETNVNKKIEEQWQNKVKKGELAKAQYNKLTTYAGHLFFTKLSPQQEEKYKRLKELKRSELNLQSLDKVSSYWQDANELIETDIIRTNKQLKYYLMGKGVIYSKGLNKINSYRSDLGYELSVDKKFRKDKEDKKIQEEELNKYNMIPMDGHYKKDTHVWDWIKQLTTEQKLRYFFGGGK